MLFLQSYGIIAVQSRQFAALKGNVKPTEQCHEQRHLTQAKTTQKRFKEHLMLCAVVTAHGAGGNKLYSSFLSPECR